MRVYEYHKQVVDNPVHPRERDQTRVYIPRRAVLGYYFIGDRSVVVDFFSEERDALAQAREDIRGAANRFDVPKKAVDYLIAQGRALMIAKAQVETSTESLRTATQSLVDLLHY